jgi:DNA end-binding protein Ku
LRKKNETPRKVYSLFVKILNETNKVAIGKVVLREKEHLVALRAYQQGLVIHQLKYLDKIRPIDEIGSLDSLQKVDAKELSLGSCLYWKRYEKDHLTNLSSARYCIT